MSSNRIRKYKRNEAYKLRREIETLYFNRFFNLWLDYFKFGDVLSDEQKYYLMLQFWETGKIAIFPLKPVNDEVVLTPFVEESWNIYNFPVNVNLINIRGVSFIPATPQEVDKDVVIGWIQKNHKSIKDILAYYIKRIAQVEMIINTNLNLQKMPYLIGVNPEDKDKMEDLIDRILDDEIVVFTDLENLELVKSFVTQTPYIIDKLNALKIQYINDALTYLGIDNSGTNYKATTQLLDEVNANNEIINQAQKGFLGSVSEIFDRVDKVFGIKISVALNVNKAEETAESRNRSIAENREEQKVEDTTEGE